VFNSSPSTQRHSKWTNFISSVHPASAKRQLANHLQVLKLRTLFCTYPVVEDAVRV
ncbi:hypothetical protein K435DRAFT_772827, partial [Dendrothele bispora CBS 962.96]